VPLLLTKCEEAQGYMPCYVTYYTVAYGNLTISGVRGYISL